MVDAAMQLQAEKNVATSEAEAGATEHEGAAGAGAGPVAVAEEEATAEADEETFEAKIDDAPAAPEVVAAPAAAPETAPGGASDAPAAVGLTAAERALWNQEFSNYDEDGSGMIDIECLSFALAKLRLLEVGLWRCDRLLTRVASRILLLGLSLTRRPKCAVRIFLPGRTPPPACLCVGFGHLGWKRGVVDGQLTQNVHLVWVGYLGCVRRSWSSDPERAMGLNTYAVLVGGANGDGAWRGLVTIVE